MLNVATAQKKLCHKKLNIFFQLRTGLIPRQALIEILLNPILPEKGSQKIQFCYTTY